MKFLKELKEDKLDDDKLKDMGKLKSFSKISDDGDKEAEEKEADSDPNRQGLIRLVKKAHLIYKRKNETDRYNELWQYKSTDGKIFHDLDIKNDILSGTDIPLKSETSEDGEQYYELWYSGKIVFLKIYNLPN